MFNAVFGLPRTVWLIDLISLVNDSVRKMLYPPIPLYLSSSIDGWLVSHHQYLMRSV
jgi:hypothetical protein